MKNVNDKDITKLLIIFFSVLIFFGVFYVITIFVSNNRVLEQPSENQVQNRNIIAGNILNRSPESYYVIVNHPDDVSRVEYLMTLDELFVNEQILPYYIVELSDGFNSSYLADEYSFDVERVNELRFNDSALLYINDGQIEDYYLGRSEITSYLASK